MIESPAWKAEIQENKRAGRLNYDKSVFFLKRPGSTLAVSGPTRVKTHGEHQKLIDDAKRRGLYVWYADVIERDGKYFANHIHLVDFDSVPAPGTTVQTGDSDTDEPIVPNIPETLVCSTCRKECSSRSGYTLHMKSHAIVDDNDPLRCDVCSKKCSSTSGLTLHKKSHK